MPRFIVWLLTVKRERLHYCLICAICALTVFPAAMADARHNPGALSIKTPGQNLISTAIQPLVQLVHQDTIYVRELVMARDVIEREPVEIVEAYSMSDGRAWCFVRIHNSHEIQNIIFHWYYEDELYFEMSSKIGRSLNWRTYSSVGLQPGSWHVEVRTHTGRLLGETRFLVHE